MNKKMHFFKKKIQRTRIVQNPPGIAFKNAILYDENVCRKNAHALCRRYEMLLEVKLLRTDKWMKEKKENSTRYVHTHACTHTYIVQTIRDAAGGQVAA